MSERREDALMVKKKDAMDHNPQAELDAIGKDEATNDIGQTLDLGTSLTIAEVTEWHDRFASAFEHGSAVALKGEGIAQIDGAGVQLLVAVMQAAVTRQVKINWSTVSETLREAVTQLGLESVFNFQKDLP